MDKQVREVIEAWEETDSYNISVRLAVALKALRTVLHNTEAFEAGRAASVAAVNRAIREELDNE